MPLQPKNFWHFLPVLLWDPMEMLSFFKCKTKAKKYSFNSKQKSKSFAFYTCREVKVKKKFLTSNRKLNMSSCQGPKVTTQK